MKTPEGMDVFEVLPRNFDAIIERSQSTRKPYTLADLKAMHAQAHNDNKVAIVAFMDLKKLYSKERDED